MGFVLYPPTASVGLTPGSVAFVGGTLIDGTGAKPVSGAVVIVKGDFIATVGTTSTLQIPEGTEIVDVRGGAILPGFINAHVHGAYDERLLKAWA
jgi:imidazolonepropionase-like amidohydrolase